MSARFPKVDMLTVGAAMLCFATVTGCGSKPEASPTSLAQTAPIQTQTVEKHSQDRARVLQTIQPMTPPQRAAYFKAHPEDVSALAR